MNGFDDLISLRIVPEGEGTVLSGRFKLLRFIGAGSVGAVYEAYDSNRSERLAIKIFYPSLVSDLEVRRKLLSTARLNSDLDYPGVLRTYDTFQGNGLFWYSMELAEGGSVRQYLEAIQKKAHPIPLKKSADWVRQMIKTLGVTSDRTAHLAIKPENLFLGKNEDLKLADFGFQSCLDRSRANFSCLLDLSIAYQPSEVLTEERFSGDIADQFSIAAVFYELLSGSPPVGVADSIRIQRKEVPRALERALNRALSPIPRKRFPTLEQFSETLDQSLRMPDWIRTALQVGGAAVFIFLMWTLSFFALPDSTLAKSFQSVFGIFKQQGIEEAALQLWDRTALQMVRCDKTRFESLAFLDAEDLESSLVENPTLMSVGLPFASLREFIRTVWSDPERDRTIAILEISKRALGLGRFSKVIEQLQVVSESTRESETQLKEIERFLHLAIEGREVAVGMFRLKGSMDAVNAWFSLLNFSGFSAESESLSAKLDSLSHFVEAMRIEAARVIGEAESRAVHHREVFVSRLGPYVVPPIHIGDPEGLFSKAVQMNGAEGWRERFDAYSEAGTIWEKWTDEFQRLPLPEGLEVKENLIRMRFVAVQPNLWFSIYETRLIDIETWVQNSGYDTDRHWRWLHDEFEQQSPFEPVVNVRLDLVTDFCIWLTKFERAKGAIPRTAVYRLATAEEWSLAAGPVESDGNRSGEADGYAGIAPVGRFAANQLGLYDMNGNVAEWCQNSADINWASIPSIFWGGTMGASWKRDVVSDAIVAGHSATPSLYRDLGFRVVLETELN